MPFLYAGRQHKRKSRESLDCAIALQELERLGVDNIITFDAHDPRVQNAIPLIDFQSIHPTYDIIKSIFNHEKDLLKDRDLSLIHISEPTRRTPISYAVFCLKKKKK